MFDCLASTVGLLVLYLIEIALSFSCLLYILKGKNNANGKDSSENDIERQQQAIIERSEKRQEVK